MNLRPSDYAKQTLKYSLNDVENNDSIETIVDNKMEKECHVYLFSLCIMH